jgi:hypothetical protein
MIFFVVVLVVLFFSLVVQTFIPPLEFLHGARVLLMPLVLFYGALAFPFSGMLALAFVAGFMWDALHTQVVDNPASGFLGVAVEVSLGWSILLYAALGAFMNGLRPLFQRGRWEIHCLLSGLCTSAIVLAEYLMISLRRGGFVFNEEIWWRIGGPGLVAVLLSPIVFFTLNRLGLWTGYDPQPARKAAH